MPQFISIALAFIFGLKDVFTTKNGKTNNKLQNLIIGVVVYFLVNRFLDQQAKDKLLKNVANDPISTFAVKLHNAINPSSIGWLNNWFGDGTDEEAIKVIATEMGKLVNFKKVSEAYQILYKTDLATDLANDGVTDLFDEYYAKGVSGGSTSTTPIPTTGNITGIVKGTKVFTKGGWNLRSTNSPYLATNTTVNGEDWIAYNKPYTATIGGTAGQWIVIQQPDSRKSFWGTQYFVVSMGAIYVK